MPKTYRRGVLSASIPPFSPKSGPALPPVIEISLVFGFSASELFLVGFIFFLVLAAPRVGRVGEVIARGVLGVDPPKRTTDDDRVAVREITPSRPSEKT